LLVAAGGMDAVLAYSLVAADWLGLPIALVFFARFAPWSWIIIGVGIGAGVWPLFLSMLKYSEQPDARLSSHQQGAPTRRRPCGLVILIPAMLYCLWIQWRLAQHDDTSALALGYWVSWIVLHIHYSIQRYRRARAAARCPAC
jgi:hypothetical protein